MRDCTGCRYASWDVTAAGRLHPSGEGRCTYAVVPAVLPASMYYSGTVWVNGGNISRRTLLSKDCACYEPKGNETRRRVRNGGVMP